MNFHLDLMSDRCLRPLLWDRHQLMTSAMMKFVHLSDDFQIHLGFQHHHYSCCDFDHWTHSVATLQWNQHHKEHTWIPANTKFQHNTIEFKWINLQRTVFIWFAQLIKFPLHWHQYFCLICKQLTLDTFSISTLHLWQ